MIFASRRSTKHHVLNECVHEYCTSLCTYLSSIRVWVLKLYANDFIESERIIHVIELIVFAIMISMHAENWLPVERQCLISMRYWLC